MSFDFSTLITDRTQNDVDAQNAKGTYNASDLNRVTEAMEYLHDLLTGYGYDTGYIPVKIPRPEAVVRTTKVNGDNIGSIFSVSNSEYFFEPSGSVWESNNVGVQSSTAKTELTALTDMTVSFSYSYSSEANYDKFTLIVAGTTVESAVSGTTTVKSYSGSLTAGQTISLQYKKDGSVNKYDDKCTMSDLIVTQTFTDPYVWIEEDIPTWGQLEQYRRNVATLRGVLEVISTTPTVPEDMSGLTHNEANDIEKILIDLDMLITNMTAAWFCSDDLYSGEV